MEYVRCPINRHHNVQPKKLIFHLMRCHDVNEMFFCQYSRSHVFANKSACNLHEKYCNQRPMDDIIPISKEWLKDIFKGLLIIYYYPFILLTYNISDDVSSVIVV